DALGMQRGVVQGDAAAERVTDQGDAREALAVQEAISIVGEVGQCQPAADPRAPSGAAQVDRHHPAPRRQTLRDPLTQPAHPPDAMNQLGHRTGVPPGPRPQRPQSREPIQSIGRYYRAAGPEFTPGIGGKAARAYARAAFPPIPTLVYLL